MDKDIRAVLLTSRKKIHDLLASRGYFYYRWGEREECRFLCECFSDDFWYEDADDDLHTLFLLHLKGQTKTLRNYVRPILDLIESKQSTTQRQHSSFGDSHHQLILCLLQLPPFSSTRHIQFTRRALQPTELSLDTLFNHKKQDSDAMTTFVMVTALMRSSSSFYHAISTYLFHIWDHLHSISIDMVNRLALFYGILLHRNTLCIYTVCSCLVLTMRNTAHCSPQHLLLRQRHFISLLLKAIIVSPVLFVTRVVPDAQTEQTKVSHHNIDTNASVINNPADHDIIHITPDDMMTTRLRRGVTLVYFILLMYHQQFLPFIDNYITQVKFPELKTKRFTSKLEKLRIQHENDERYNPHWWNYITITTNTASFPPKFAMPTLSWQHFRQEMIAYYHFFAALHLSFCCDYIITLTQFIHERWYPHESTYDYPWDHRQQSTSGSSHPTSIITAIEPTDDIMRDENKRQWFLIQHAFQNIIRLTPFYPLSLQYPIRNLPRYIGQMQFHQQLCAAILTWFNNNSGELINYNPHPPKIQSDEFPVVETISHQPTAEQLRYISGQTTDGRCMNIFPHQPRGYSRDFVSIIDELIDHISIWKEVSMFDTPDLQKIRVKYQHHAIAKRKSLFQSLYHDSTSDDSTAAKLMTSTDISIDNDDKDRSNRASSEVNDHQSQIYDSDEQYKNQISIGFSLSSSQQHSIPITADAASTPSAAPLQSLEHATPLTCLPLKRNLSKINQSRHPDCRDDGDDDQDGDDGDDTQQQVAHKKGTTSTSKVIKRQRCSD